jgi:hypothetical protein
MSLCVECREPFYETSALNYQKGCPCLVHPLCWESRLQLCISAGVVKVSCSCCWTVLWTKGSARKKMASEEPEAVPSKKRGCF